MESHRWATTCGQSTRRRGVVGGTFKFTFELPKPANRGNTNGRKNKAGRGGRQKATRAAEGRNVRPYICPRALSNPDQPISIQRRPQKPTEKEVTAGHALA